MLSLGSYLKVKTTTMCLTSSEGLEHGAMNMAIGFHKERSEARDILEGFLGLCRHLDLK